MMQVAATIKLHRCERCGALCGPKAGRFMRVHAIKDNEVRRIWLCLPCVGLWEQIASIPEAGVKP